MAKDFQSMVNKFSSPKVKKNETVVEKSEEPTGEIDVKKEVEKILDLKTGNVCHCKECGNYIENDKKYPNNCLALNEIIPVDKCWACVGRKCSCKECGNYVEDDKRYVNNCKVLETVISKENCWAKVSRQEAEKIALSSGSIKTVNDRNKIRIESKRKIVYVSENTIPEIIDMYKDHKISYQLLRKIGNLDRETQLNLSKKIVLSGKIIEDLNVLVCEESLTA